LSTQSKSKKKQTPPKSPVTSPPARAPSRAHDPHLDREQRKYENPIPSRELILDVLTEAGVPMDAQSIAQQLEIADAEQEGFVRRLNAMERDGQIMRNRRGDICLIDKLDLITGKVQGHPDGFGFLVPDDGSDDLFLGPKQMHRALHGDRVVVREIGVDRKGRREASIVEVLERANTKVVGRLFVERGVFFVIAENKRINQDILIEPGYDKGAVAGQVVVVELVVQPSKNSEPLARVVEILGNYADPGMEIEIALRKHDLPHEWPSDILALEKKIPKKVTPKEIVGRADLRDLPFVTIDGETAKDFDDAVYCEKQGKGFRLMVAIADVSHYVKTGDALDREARLRGNSVYFPRRVIPMLPEALSNEMCSLNPHVDRLALVCDMAISATGEVKRYEFMEAVFHSAARLTYTNVAKALYSLEPDHGIPANLIPHLKALDDVFRALLAARNKRGAIDFDSTETMMVFTDESKIEKIVPVTRNDAHRLIEECMLAANVCAANYLLENEHPNLYRIHEKPTEEKLTALRSMLKDFGLQLAGGATPTPREYGVVLEKIRARPDAPLLQTVMLRSMKQAVYSPDNAGHFGLAYDAYAHFTSPIRRYPDLLTHRAIKAVLKGETYDPKAPWDVLGQQCSATERRADEATRDVTNWLKCYYMKDRLGEEFTGTISGVTSFGIFVTLDDVYVEGLVHISELGHDYFHFEQDKHRIMGERTRKVFQLADRVNIKVVRVDIETSKIDFALVDARFTKSGPVTITKPAQAPTAPSPLKKVAKAIEPMVQVETRAKSGVKKPSPPPMISPPVPERSDKKIMSVTSANPPTTPLAGFTNGGVEKKKTSGRKQPAAPETVAKTRQKKSSGVLLGGKEDGGKNNTKNNKQTKTAVTKKSGANNKTKKAGGK
jgi:ribonuclease R